MIGYTVGIKAYMLWDLRKKKIVISCDVLFNEQPLILPSGTPETDLTGFNVQDASESPPIVSNRLHESGTYFWILSLGRWDSRESMLTSASIS